MATGSATGWLFQAKGGGDEPPHKKIGVANVVDQTLQTELDHLILSVSNATMIRQQMGAIYLSAQAPAAIVEVPVNAIKAFAEATRGQSKHKLGHPHIQGYGAFLDNLVSQVQNKLKEGAKDTKLEEALTILTQTLENMTKEGVEHAHFHISQFVCRMTKSNDEMGTVNMCLSDMMDPMERAKANRALVYSMEALGAKVNQGGPPPSPAERRMKERIAQIKKQMGIVDKAHVKTATFGG
jgi:hypothetical protein